MPSDAYDYLREHHDRLATALGKNTDVANFIQSVLEHLIDKAASTGQALSALEVETPQIVREGNSYYISAGIR